MNAHPGEEEGPGADPSGGRQGQADEDDERAVANLGLDSRLVSEAKFLRDQEVSRGGSWRPLGEILVEQGHATPEQIRRALTASEEQVHATPRHSAPLGMTPGQLLYGRYRVLRRLGEGGFGTVYLAQDTEGDQQVAIKMPLERVPLDAEHEARFKSEMWKLTELRHPGIVKILRFHESLYYLVTEYIDGWDLATYVEEYAAAHGGGPIPPGRSAKIVLDIADVLGFVHSRGIVHRDLKPQNVMIRRDESVVIMDFGLAKDLSPGGDDESLTASGTALGTWPYMAPEQIHGRKDLISPRTDVWALGVVLYELLAGHRPFRGSNSGVTIAKILGQPPEPFKARECGLPPAIDEVIGRCLKKQPRDRYANASEVAAALRSALLVLTRAEPDAPPRAKSKPSAQRATRAPAPETTPEDFVSEESSTHSNVRRGETSALGMAGYLLFLIVPLGLVLWIFMPPTRAVEIAGGAWLLLTVLSSMRRGDRPVRLILILMLLAFGGLLGLVLWIFMSAAKAFSIAGGIWLVLSLVASQVEEF